MIALSFQSETLSLAKVLRWIGRIEDEFDRLSEIAQEGCVTQEVGVDVVHSLCRFRVETSRDTFLLNMSRCNKWAELLAKKCLPGC